MFDKAAFDACVTTLTRAVKILPSATNDSTLHTLQCTVGALYCQASERAQTAEHPLRDAVRTVLSESYDTTILELAVVDPEDDTARQQAAVFLQNHLTLTLSLVTLMDSIEA